MSVFEEKEVYIYDSEKPTEPFGDFILKIPQNFDGYTFYRIRKDSVGKSGANPTWGDLYRYTNHELYYMGNCIYKEMDYDFPNAPYAEKLWSILGKRVLKDCRIPDITLVKDAKYKETGLFSHIILDNDTEDLISMSNLLFYKYERQTLNTLRSVIPFQDLLECVKMQINNEKNFKNVESQMVRTLLLDSITNNADRHTNNWALVRDKQHNIYTLGLFDHSSSFIDMVSARNGTTVNGWTSSFISTGSKPNINGVGDLGNRIVENLFQQYPDISKEFMNCFHSEIENFYKDISSAPYYIDYRRIKYNIAHKEEFMRNLMNQLEEREGGIEHE